MRLAGYSFGLLKTSVVSSMSTSDDGFSYVSLREDKCWGCLMSHTGKYFTLAQRLVSCEIVVHVLRWLLAPTVMIV